MSFETDLRNSCNLTDAQMRRIFTSPQMKILQEVCRRHPSMLTGSAWEWATGLKLNGGINPDWGTQLTIEEAS
jgi:hypothetical protein